jgi:hypothetical protein
MSTDSWEVGDVAALLANPLYAIEIHQSFGRSHEHVLSESTWIDSNSSAIEELRPVPWLRCLLSALKAPHGLADLGGPLQVADPYPVVTIDRMLCLPHEPIVSEDVWIGANAIALEEDARVWLQNFLSVLKGGYA